MWLSIYYIWPYVIWWKSCLPISALIFYSKRGGIGKWLPCQELQLPGSWLYPWQYFPQLGLSGSGVSSRSEALKGWLSLLPLVCLFCPADAQWLEQGCCSTGSMEAPDYHHGNFRLQNLGMTLGWVGQCQKQKEGSSHPTQWNRKSPFMKKKITLQKQQFQWGKGG